MAEAFASERDSWLLAHGGDESTMFLDLVREASDGFSARRQILALPNNVWIVLDAFSDQTPRQAQIVWLSDDRTSVSATESRGTYLVTSELTRAALFAQFISSEDAAPFEVYGQQDPLIGWVIGADVRKAPALVMQQSSQGTWTANISVLEPHGRSRFAGRVRMASWKSPEQWHIVVPLMEGTLHIERDAARLQIRGAGSASLLTLAAISRIDQGDESAYRAYESMVSEYGASFRPYIEYRISVSKIMVFLFAAHIVFLLVLIRYDFIGRSFLSVTPLAAWVILFFWLHLYYF